MIFSIDKIFKKKSIVEKQTIEKVEKKVDPWTSSYPLWSGIRSKKFTKDLTRDDIKIIFLLTEDKLKRIPHWSKEEAFFNVLMCNYANVAIEITNHKQFSYNYPLNDKQKSIIKKSIKKFKENMDHNREKKLNNIL